MILKKIICGLLIILAGVIGCGDSGDGGDGDNDTPEVRPTTKIQFSITSTNLPIDSINWKYEALNTTSAVSNYFAERLGKASNHESPDAYVSLYVETVNSFYAERRVWLSIYAPDRSTELYRSVAGRMYKSTYERAYNGIIEVMLDWIINNPESSYSGYLDVEIF